MKKTPTAKRAWTTHLVFSLTASMTLASGQATGPNRENRGSKSAPIPRSMPRHERPSPRQEQRTEEGIELPTEYRSINGSGNNLANPNWGAAQQPFLRLFANGYADSISLPPDGRPSARAVSNAIAAQTDSILNNKGASDFLWQWGQFLDHDIVETPTIDPAEPFNIEVPMGDPFFDPTSTGSAVITLNRSLYEEEHGVREQVNEISSYIDASMVYGSDDERAFALRRLDGSGMLKVTQSDHGDLLPYNEGGFANAPTSSPNFFLAGDVRANEQAALAAMHTLFLREHNHWAEKFSKENPQAMDEEIYQFARMIVAAEIQAITYREFLPVLLGRTAIPRYRGYRENVRADVSNAFGAAAYRIGHSMLSSNLLRLDAQKNEIEAGHLSLAGAFFNPSLIEDEGIDSLLRGLATQQCQELDEKVIDEVRNFLFGPPGAGGFDLASLNIQRGRDHGLPDYQSARERLGLRKVRHVRQITRKRETVSAIREVYPNLDAMDLWPVALCERDVRDSMVGPTLQRILVNQFRRLRDGDRFYYEGHLPKSLVKLVNNQTLAKIIRRNTDIGREIQDNVFLTEPKSPPSPRRPRGRRR